MSEISQTKITILDYGMCNLFNVVRAFEHCGADVQVANNPKQALHAERLVVPGVGAFKDSMKELAGRGFGDVIKQFALIERPLLGICVGMQILFESSDEFGEHAGLGVLKGRVQALPQKGSDGRMLKIPHIGWSNLIAPNKKTWHDSLLDGFEGKSPSMYFVHSFAASPLNTEDRLADCFYGGHHICAAVQRGTVMATQFHPERSGFSGLAVLKKFMKL